MALNMTSALAIKSEDADTNQVNSVSRYSKQRRNQVCNYGLLPCGKHGHTAAGIQCVTAR